MQNGMRKKVQEIDFREALENMSESIFRKKKSF